MTTGDAMTRLNRAVVAMAVLALMPVAAVDAQQKGVKALSDSDIAAIKALNVAYGTALGMCKYEEYAALYAAPDGYFASGPRGRVAGRERLIELSKSEPFCHDGSEKKARNLPSKVEAEATAEGAKGRVELAPTPGHYEDTYVKTSQGWRFKSHTYISTGEKAAGMTAADFEEIRKLAGNDSGQFQDVWADFPDGKRFRSSGISIAAKEGAPVTGRGLLADGGRYEDEYVKAASGWKFKSRKYTPPATATASASAPPAASRRRSHVRSSRPAGPASDAEDLDRRLQRRAGQARRGPVSKGLLDLPRVRSPGAAWARPGVVGDAVHDELGDGKRRDPVRQAEDDDAPQQPGEPDRGRVPRPAGLHAEVEQLSRGCGRREDGRSGGPVLREEGRLGQEGVQNFAMVGMVGCLAQAGNRWVLTDTTEPQSARDEAATSAEWQAAAAKPAGGDTVRLVSAQGFDPARHQGHQVYVKGLLNRMPSDSRLNVTALQSLESRCPQPR